MLQKSNLGTILHFRSVFHLDLYSLYEVFSDKNIIEEVLRIENMIDKQYFTEISSTISFSVKIINGELKTLLVLEGDSLQFESLDKWKTAVNLFLSKVYMFFKKEMEDLKIEYSQKYIVVDFFESNSFLMRDHS